VGVGFCIGLCSIAAWRTCSRNGTPCHCALITAPGARLGPLALGLCAGPVCLFAAPALMCALQEHTHKLGGCAVHSSTSHSVHTSSHCLKGGS
jgi:hypothetical protein